MVRKRSQIKILSTVSYFCLIPEIAVGELLHQTLAHGKSSSIHIVSYMYNICLHTLNLNLYDFTQ